MATTYPISQAYTDGQVLSASNVNQIAGGVNDLAALQINSQTTSYTLVLSDAAKLIYMNSGSALNLNVPTNATVAFGIGTQIMVMQYGSGQVTVQAVSAGTTSIRSQGNKTKTNGLYSMVCLMKLATDEWVLFGNTSA